MIFKDIGNENFRYSSRRRTHIEGKLLELHWYYDYYYYYYYYYCLLLLLLVLLLLLLFLCAGSKLHARRVFQVTRLLEGHRTELKEQARRSGQSRCQV